MHLAILSALLVQASTFGATSSAFSACLVASVRMGMTLKMEPGVFQVGFAKACLAEQANFRADAIKLAMSQGRSEAAAIAEVDGNIANARRIFAGDEASYFATGKVPH